MGSFAWLQAALAVMLAQDPVAAPAAPVAPAAPAVDRAAFDRCLDRLARDAAANGVRRDLFERLVRGITPDTSVLALLDAQPEFSTPVWDYLAGLVDEERVADGRAMLRRHAGTLAAIEARYGVDPATVVAVWGVESDYGRTTGTRPLLNSLTTLSCMGRRQGFFRAELLATLQILQAGDVEPQALVGSWAGAFGHTQFIPSTYRRVAVDFDGDGRRDLVGSIPDALASTAHYLQRAGWRSGQSWGHEVRLPAGPDAGVTGRRHKRPAAHWARQGLTLADGRVLAGAGSPLASDAPAALLLPAGRAGPAFLVLRNFDAIHAYNASDSYALAIALLADRLRGGGGPVAAWPTDDPGLSRHQRRELQVLLLQRGHPIGEPDAVLGSRTRAAIRLEQQRLGLPVDGRAGQRVLRALRDDAPGAGAR